MPAPDSANKAGSSGHDNAGGLLVMEGVPLAANCTGACARGRSKSFQRDQD